MEHRCNIRKPHACDVFVESPPGDPKRVRSHNISAGGIFVDVAGDIVTLNTIVTVSFSLRRGNHAADFRMSAMVVRLTARGAALMFLDIDAETHGRLAAVLRRMPKAVSQAQVPAGLGAAELSGQIVNG
jgi:c-di-GMP-binding flagellar brake protein YcgR